MSDDALDRLSTVVEGIGPLAVAVSGGVDSMTLSAVANRVLGTSARMLHAVSPAVPEDATHRVIRYAEREGWALKVIDAREFHDPSYIANPVNRCFYCKTNLYDTMAHEVDTVLVSGTNLDDLGDYRPGLTAAKTHGVRHPFVEADIDKATVRTIARALGLDDLAELPASPCLSSRVETGIPIDANALRAIYRIEKHVQRQLSPQVVRCRLRRERVVVELDHETLTALSAAKREQLVTNIGSVLVGSGVGAPVDFAVYKMGSAFLRTGNEG